MRVWEPEARVVADLGVDDEGVPLLVMAGEWQERAQPRRTEERWVGHRHYARCLGCGNFVRTNGWLGGWHLCGGR